MNQPEEEQESTVTLITDACIWILFTISLLTSAILLVTGLVATLINPQLSVLIYYLTASISLAIHVMFKRELD